MKTLKRSQLFGLMVLLSYLLILTSDVPVLGTIGHILYLFSTLCHEMGHGITTILVGGKFQSVTISWDASGLTHSLYPSGAIRSGLISAGGLIGPSIAAALLFWVARGSDRRVTAMTTLLGLGLVVAGVFTARSIWALVFTLGLGSLLLVLSRKWSRAKIEALLVFLGVQLGISVFTRSDYLFTRSAGPGQASDVQQMAEALFPPFWFWGLLCGAISLLVLYWGFRCYTRETERSESRS